MATTFTLVTDCPYPASVMFDVSLDIDAHLESMADSGERAVAGVTSGLIGLGETVTWRARHFGIWFTMTSKIVALDRPSRFVDEQQQGPFASFSHEHLFEALPSDGGHCRMPDTLTLAAPIGGALAERFVLVPYIRRLIRQRNRTLLDRAGQQQQRARQRDERSPGK